jgi:hypothetical protein
MAEFRAPLDVAITSDGTIYVADAINHRIRKISQGQVFTFAGIGVQDTTSGNGTVAGFAFPVISHLIGMRISIHWMWKIRVCANYHLERLYPSLQETGLMDLQMADRTPLSLVRSVRHRYR